MKNQATYLLLPLIVLLSCASAPSTASPPWARNVQAVYPWDTYITGRGEGISKQDAEIKAVAEIVRYIDQEIRVKRSSNVLWTTQGGATVESRETGEDILVEAQMRLMTVRYAEDPWYNPAVKAWQTVAFINREEVWTVYEPVAKKQAEALLALSKAAEEETEPFNTTLWYITAAAYAGSNEFNTVREFAQILNSKAANALFAGSDTAVKELPRKQTESRRQARIYIDCPTDYNRMIYQAMVKALGETGFPAEDNRRAAAAICTVQVEEGERKADLGIFYNPILTGTISGKSGTLFSFKIQGERQGAVTPEVAKHRAYTALAEALESGFPAELNRAGNTLVSK